MQNNLKIIIITESEPFYLAEALKYFLSHKIDGYEINSAYIINYFQANLFSANKIKYLDVLRTFGFGNFIQALYRIISGKLNKAKNVKNIFKASGIPVINGIKNINSTEIINSIKKQNPDLLIAIGVNSLFNKDLRDLAKYGCLNVHSGIKAKHRGRAPIFWALMDGDNETGVTIHYIDDGIDNGKTLVTRKYIIKQRSLDRVLHDIRMLGMDALFEALVKIRDNDIKHNAKSKANSQEEPLIYRPYPTRHDLKEFINRGNSLF